MKIIPAILTSDPAVVQQQVNLVKEFLPAINTVQIDVGDENFADQLTVTPSDLVDIKWGELMVDWHLMVNEPLDFFRETLDLGDDRIPTRAMIAQIEHTSDIGLFVHEVSTQGWRAGISLDLYTPIEEIDWNWLDQGLKIIQLMAVEAGRQGQEFNPLVLQKIKTLQQKIFELGLDLDGENLEIVVDGGITTQKLRLLAEKTEIVDTVAIGSYLWKQFSNQNSAVL